MPGLKRSRGRQEEDVDIDMVPIMNMFLVLIPFLLMSASFLHIKAINTSVPVQAESSASSTPGEEVKVTVVVQLGEKAIGLSALSDALPGAELRSLEANLPQRGDGSYPLDDLVARLEAIKERYPSSDTMLLIPEETVLYETIIETMDAARYCRDTSAEPAAGDREERALLFPNVVLSGKVG